MLSRRIRLHSANVVMWVVLWRHAGERWLLPQQLYHRKVAFNHNTFIDSFLHFCACLVETSPHQLFCFTRRHCCFWHKAASVESGQLFHQYCRPLVATAEVLERCKVQRGSVWSGLGDPSHVSLLMLSRGEADTQPTGVTVPLPKPLSHRENGAETRDLLVSLSPAYPLFPWFADLFRDIL